MTTSDHTQVGDVPARAVLLPMRTVLLVAATIALMGAFWAIGDTFLVVFVGIFLALVFEAPLRYVMAKTNMSRGLASARSPCSGRPSACSWSASCSSSRWSVRCATSSRIFRRRSNSSASQTSCSGWFGDSGAADNVQSGADEVSSAVPDAISAVLGIAGDFVSTFLVAFTIIFICMFLLTDVVKLKAALGSVLMPGDDVRWLDVWERVTTSISRWAIGVVVIAAIAGTTQGLTAWLLGSSYALALGVIAGLLDMIPNLGATLAGVILVPALWAEEGITAAIIMLVVLLVYQQVENNVLTPKIQGKAVNLSGFFIIIAVTLFGALLGVLGALTAVPARRDDPDLCPGADEGA